MSSDGFVEVKLIEPGSGPEPLFLCVQCHGKYKESQNAEGSCSFHSGTGKCCGQRVPCQNTKHRPKHHNDWPYSEYFNRCWDIFNYTDTHERFLDITEVSMDGGEEQKAMVGRLIRWKSRSAPVPNDTIFVKVGQVWHTSKNYFFEVYTVEELKALPKPTKAPYRSTIYRTSQENTEYAMAEWQFSPAGAIVGCVLTCKARDNAEPTSKSVAIIFNPLAGGEITVFSEGSFREYGPEGGSTQYQAAVNKFNEACPKPKIGGDSSRKPRSFSSTGDLPAILWVTSPLECADSRRDQHGKGQDLFNSEVSLYNTSKESFLLTHVSAEYRFVGEKEFKPVNGLTISRARTFVPTACSPLSQFPLTLQFGIPSDGPAGFHGARGRSLCAGKAPIRVRVSAKDLDGATVSIVQEFLNEPVKVEGPKPEDTLFVYADNVVLEERAAVHCSVTQQSGSLKVSVGSSSIDEDRLRRLAGEACAKKVSELPFNDLSSNYSSYNYGAVALVDQSCQRVWAIQVNVKRSDCDATGSGVMALPLYGKTTPTRAVSIVSPTHVEAKSEESKGNGAGNADDTFDDLPANYTRSVRQSAPSALEQIQRSLQNIEVALQHIATGIKK